MSGKRRKPKTLSEPRIFYDRQVKMWVVIDKDSGVATQAENIPQLMECFIDALRCMCASFQDHYGNRRAGKGEKP